MNRDQQDRRQRAQFSDQREDQLPPNDAAAEQAILACCMMNGNCVAQTVAYFRGEPVFYSERCRLVWDTIQLLQSRSLPVDTITLDDALRSLGHELEPGWLGALQDGVPSAANLPSYLEIVWGKFLARRALSAATLLGAEVMENNGFDALMLERIEARVTALREQSARHTDVMPAHLKTLDAFEQKYTDMWFGSEKGEPGWSLPFEFPLKIRLGELTFLIAEKGAGKSTLMSYIRLHLANQGQKVCVASMETKPEVTLKIMASQLIGACQIIDNEYGRSVVKATYDWMRSRVLIYDFLGIADWRDILHAFEFAATLGYTVFEIDSVMRIGIMDDDYATQGLAAKSYANFAATHNAHLFIVNHLNKSDRDVKSRSRGSQQWIDNSNNVVSVHLNGEKHAQIDELKEQLRTKKISGEVYTEKLAEKAGKFDSHFDLHNQRWPGSQQNGRRYLYFNRDSLQLHEKPFTPSTDWLAQWRDAKPAAPPVQDEWGETKS